MSDSKNFLERRKSKRYSPAKGAFAVVKPDFSLMGPIVDISIGGISFSYLDSKNRLENVTSISVLFVNKYIVKNLPVETISDNMIDAPLSGDYARLRRHGLKFKQLLPHQTSKLEDFIQNHTIQDNEK